MYYDMLTTRLDANFELDDHHHKIIAITSHKSLTDSRHTLELITVINLLLPVNKYDWVFHHRVFVHVDVI